MVHVCNSGKHVFPDGQSARASACCANFVHVCISGRHRCPDIQSAKASACCASFERTGDKDELLRQQKAQEETVNASEKSTSKCAEEIASRQKLLAELEDSLAQAKAKRNEIWQAVKFRNQIVPWHPFLPTSRASKIKYRKSRMNFRAFKGSSAVRPSASVKSGENSPRSRSTLNEIAFTLK